MEHMPFRAEVETTSAPLVGHPAEVRSTNWRDGLPVLVGPRVTLRELRHADAPSLLSMLTTEEVTRFISPPPTDVEGFERFIGWTHRERALGRQMCFAVVPEGMDSAVGLIQIRQLDPAFFGAEWGFAIGSPFWGNGMFPEAARMAIDFVFGQVGIHRLEARVAVRNGRGNGILRKLGAVQEGLLRHSFVRRGQNLDQILWSILDEDWRHAKAVRKPIIH